MTFKPMLAGVYAPALQQYPALVSPKLDGVRAIVTGDRQVLSRSLKPIPNTHVQASLAFDWLGGCDGELIVGDPTSPSCYRDTSSGVMSVHGKPDFTFYVFDVFDKPNVPFQERMPQGLNHRGEGYKIQSLPQELVSSEDELLAVEEQFLAQGYEGVMLRALDGLYKHGRSTARQGWLLKLKRMSSSEAEVLEVIEEMQNTNSAELDELGHTKRSTHKENLVPKGRMGALRVRCLTTGVEFQIGTGFTAVDRQEFWDSPPIGKIITYNHFEVGRKDLPRFPSYKGLREAIDMEAA